MLGFTSAAVARGMGDWRDRFWISVAASILQLGLITSILSVFHALTPGYFLVCQAVLLAIAVVIWVRAREASPARAGLPRAAILCLAPVGLMIVLIGAEKFVLPVSNTDDRLYYAS